MKPYMLFETDRIIDDGDFIIYYARHIQSLFEVNKVTGEAKLLWKNSSQEDFRSFIYYNDKYIFFPCGVGNCGILDLKRNDFKCLEIPQNLHLPSEHNWSANYIHYMDSLFFYWQNPVVTQYNLATGEWKIYREWQKELPSEISPNHWMIWNAFSHNDKLYFPIGESNYLLEMDPKNDKTNIIELKIPVTFNEIQFVFYKNQKLYILCVKDNNQLSILESDSFLTSSFEEICQIPNLSYDIDSFISQAVGKENMWLFPCEYDKAYKINLTSGICEICSDIPIAVNMFNDYNYPSGFHLGDNYWSINTRIGDLVKIDLLNDKVSSVKIKFSFQEYEKIIGLTDFVHENINFDINELLNVLAKDFGGLKDNVIVSDNIFLGNDCRDSNNVVLSGNEKQCVKKEIELDYNSEKYNDRMAECKKRQKWNTLFF